ncbi:MAG: hypothetical protein ABSA43_01900 [Candidatus Microgenomates bacterium]
MGALLVAAAQASLVPLVVVAALSVPELPEQLAVQLALLVVPAELLD